MTEEDTERNTEGHAEEGHAEELEAEEIEDGEKKDKVYIQRHTR